jgi:hypothetical protein
VSISIAALELARRGMTLPESYSHDETNSGAIEISGEHTVWVDSGCDARGIVATVKAAPALIALAKALHEWSALYRSIEREDPDGKMDPMLPRATELGGALADAWTKVELALAEVQP